MSLKKVEQVKSEKGFKLPDLIVYGIILLLVAALLITTFATRNKDPFHGVKIYVNNTAVMSYNFDNGDLNIIVTDGSVEKNEEDEGVITVKVRTGGDGYNLIEINRSSRSVRVVEANCSSHDCVHTPAIKDNNGIIFCSPHRLRIIPFNFEVEDDGGDKLI